MKVLNLNPNFIKPMMRSNIKSNLIFFTHFYIVSIFLYIIPFYMILVSLYHVGAYVVFLFFP